MTLGKTTRRILILGISLLAGTLLAQQTPAAGETGEIRDKAPAIKPEAEPAATNSSAAVFSTAKQRLSYALGVDLARTLKWKGIDVDADLLVKALRDTLAGNKLLVSDQELEATLKTFEAERKQGYEHAKSMLADKNRHAGEAFFAENIKKEGVVTLPSGLQYKVLKQGEGKKPTLEDKVICNYRGTVLGGTEFDSSDKHKGVPLPVKKLIKGWSEALQLMPVGSKWQLFIPPHLAYGERLVGNIGPSATLVFEVELISIEDTVRATAQTVQAATK